MAKSKYLDFAKITEPSVNFKNICSQCINAKKGIIFYSHNWHVVFSNICMMKHHFLFQDRNNLETEVRLVLPQAEALSLQSRMQITAEEDENEKKIQQINMCALRKQKYFSMTRNAQDYCNFIKCLIWNVKNFITQTNRWISSSGDYIILSASPPIQVGFFRAMFSTTKHLAYHWQETISSMTYEEKKRKAGQLVIRMATACHRKYVEV